MNSFITNINMEIVITLSIIIFLLSMIVVAFFKNRLKVYAIMIPLWTTISVVVYYLYTKVSLFDIHKETISVMANINESGTADETFINKAIESIEKLMTDNFKTSIDFVIGLLGIVISVWVGLTIYNAVKKDELDKLVENVNNSNDLNLKVHMSNLYKTFDSNWTSSEYYLKEFPKINWSLLDSDIISDILLVENCFQRIVKYYDKNQYENILSLIPHAFELCDALKKALQKNSNDNSTIKGYYYQRKADFLYYKGMGEKYTGKYSKESVEDALGYYKKATKEEREINYHGYIDNTIGYLLYLLSKFEKKDDYLKQAEKYLVKACKEDNYLYYKNLGCVYESSGKIDLAETYYKKAISFNSNDYKSRICLASLLIKRLQKELDINSSRTKLLSEYNLPFKEEYITLMEDIEQILNVAEKISPSMIDVYYKRGQLLTYRYMLDKNNSDKVLKDIEKTFAIARELNTTFTAHLFHERNFYEAIDQIEKANAINNSLLPEGDSEVIFELYSKKLEERQYERYTYRKTNSQHTDLHCR